MEAYEQRTDEELMDAIVSGDCLAMDFLIDRYKNMVRGKARTLFLTGADKEDLIQEGMIGLYKAIRDFKQEKETSFRHFADLCVTRQMYSAIKTSNTKKNQPLNNYISFESLNVETPEEDSGSRPEIFFEKMNNPEELVIDKETTDMLEYTLVGRLSKMEREVLSYYMQDYNYSHIALILGKEPKAVDNAIQRIKKKLAQVIEELTV